MARCPQRENCILNLLACMRERERVNDQLSNLQEVYGLGGRAFLVLNLAPVGCYPALLVERPNNSSDVDEFGCVISYNNAVVDYNNMLKESLTQTGEALSNASLIYVDTHSVLLQLFRHPTSYGTIFTSFITLYTHQPIERQNITCITKKKLRPSTSVLKGSNFFFFYQD